MLKWPKIIETFDICQVTQEKFVHWVCCRKRLFPDKACKKHWKQQLTVKTLVHSTEGNRNLQDVLVWKPNLVLSKSRNCWRQCYQCYASKGCGWLPQQPFWVKPKKNHLLLMSAIAHNWSFFAIFQQRFLSPRHLKSALQSGKQGPSDPITTTKTTFAPGKPGA